jgi:hypothetical protein
VVVEGLLEVHEEVKLRVKAVISCSKQRKAVEEVDLLQLRM